MNTISSNTGPGFFARLRFKVYEILSPQIVERRIARAFVTPRRQLVPEYAPLDLPTPTEDLLVRSGDKSVAAWRWGDGRAVLLVHGWEDDHHCFDHLIAQFITKKIPVIAFDLPAHGKSTGHRTALPEIRRAIFDVAEALGPVRAIVGHSLGAAGAVLAVAEGLAVERAVTVASPISVSDGLRAIIRRYGFSPARLSGIERELQRIVGVSVESLALEAAAPKLKIPALIMHSFNDRMVPFDGGKRLAAAWRGSRFVAIEKLGHRRMLAERSTLDQIVEFLMERTKLTAVAA